MLRTILGKHAELIILPIENGRFNRAAFKDHLNEKLAGVMVQYPNFFGIVEDFQEIADLTHNVGGLFITSTPEPMSLGLFEAPGSFGTDIAVGEGLSFGIPLTFGGPALGIFTTREKYLRQMPGRLCGETVDLEGRRSYTLTLSTREQHIRREKATSNICTNQAHCATTAAIYLSLIGKEGFRDLAETNAAKTRYALQQFTTLPGVKAKFSGTFFNECVIELPISADRVLTELRKENIHGGVNLEQWYPNLKNCLLVCCTEKNRREEIDRYVEVLRKIL